MRARERDREKNLSLARREITIGKGERIAIFVPIFYGRNFKSKSKSNDKCRGMHDYELRSNHESNNHRTNYFVDEKNVTNLLIYNFYIFTIAVFR